MEQRPDDRYLATDPRASAWVQANAGTGKTTVLMRRLLALLLNQAAPQSILCATFTRAAAREIINRVSQKLYQWSVLPKAELAKEISDLFRPDSKQLAKYLETARFLYADIEDKLLVQTLHQFCDRLVRAYPLEVGLLPNFSVLGQEEETEERLAFFDRRLPNLLQRIHQNADYEAAFRTILEKEDFYKWLENLAKQTKQNRDSVPNQLAKFLEDEFATYKRERNWLNHDQQISLALQLLRDHPAVVAQFTADQQIKHILLDETQDMDDSQWQVINKISDNFFATSDSQLAGEKTIFAVGDVKQTVYRWRGANPKLFVHYGEVYQQQALTMGRSFNSLMIAGSFRSGPRILRFVDQLFSQLPRRLQTEAYFSQLQHSSKARHQQDSVRVYLPSRDPSQPAPDVGSLRMEIATQVAEEIKQLLASKVKIASRGNRSIKPGDIMVVLRKRTDHLHLDIARHLKSYQIPVAEPDRINLNENLVVKDLLALAKFVLLPEDDFNLSVVLKGPLFCLSDQELYALRKVQRVNGFSFWQLLQQPLASLPEAVRMAVHRTLTDLLASYTSSASGLDFLNRLLVSYRDVFPACQEIEALLNYCYQFEANKLSSLGAFIAHFELMPREIKRDFDQEENKVRMTTVHSAKGLQAPVVFFVAVTADASKDLKQNDYASILYVALTRAEEKLFLFIDEKKTAAGSWLDLIRSTCKRFSAAQTGELPQVADGFWTLGKSLPAAEATTQVDQAVPSPPEWLISQHFGSQPASKPEQLGRPKFKLGKLPSTQLGTVIHQLLELLPQLPIAKWYSTAINWLAKSLPTLSSEQRAIWSKRVIGSLEAIRLNSELQCLFSPEALTEVSIIHNGQLFKIDRCYFGAGKCVILDYKTDYQVPKTLASVPEAYLRQLWNYGQALAPDAVKVFALVWVREEKIMFLNEKELKTKVQEIENGPSDR